MAKFEVSSPYSPAGDQPQAIEKISAGIMRGERYQTLIGVTGSGKTYTMAKIIEQTQLPTIIMTHNKTLAAQLYSEFKSFFPKNHVEYFISYYDYYQPEAYIPRQDLFIEKDSSINDELERMRLSSTASLLTYNDVIVVASVSANYGLGDPDEYKAMVQIIEVGLEINQRAMLLRLVEMGYKRNDSYFDRGDFRVNGDVVDIYPAYSEEEAIRIEFFGDEVESIYSFEVLSNKKIESFNKTTIFAASQFVVQKEKLIRATQLIEKELEERLQYYSEQERLVEYQRLKQRTEFDLEMLETTGTCKGVENYSRHLSGKKEGETPYTLLDYMSQQHKDYLVIVDESHVSLPQFRAMYAGDRSRKEVLVDYGFRLPSALDNRPLRYEEYINKANRYLFVSATPTDVELELSTNKAELIIRPTGLVDPEPQVRPISNQVEDLFDEIQYSISQNERVLITTLTKKMSEALTTHYSDLGIRVQYLHSEIDAIERNQIIRGLRLGDFDVLIGINLLREGLDLPEVGLVAILDADKEGFLRSQTALTQTMGRASRNVNGRVILYADKITSSMQRALDVSSYWRNKQKEHNKKYNITPRSASRSLDKDLKVDDDGEIYAKMKRAKMDKMPKGERQALIKEMTKKMHEAAKKLDFEEAARFRDEIEKIRKL